MSHLFFSVIRETTILVPIIIMSIMLMCVTFILQRDKGDNYTCAYYNYVNHMNVCHSLLNYSVIREKTKLVPTIIMSII